MRKYIVFYCVSATLEIIPRVFHLRLFNGFGDFIVFCYENGLYYLAGLFLGVVTRV